MVYLISYLIIMNALGLALMHADKKKAKKHQWRIPESTLFLTALLGGSIGSLMGMYRFRHKTKHLSFVIGMPTILISQIILAVLLLQRL